MPIRYTRVGWQDAPSTDTPIDAANLNHMDNGILAISEELDTELPLLDERLTTAEEEVGAIPSIEQRLTAVEGATKSHIGMVVMSTTLDTMAKVIEIYGGTTWIRHSGYFLYGATENVRANNAARDGGEANVTLTEAQMPAHTHAVSEHRHAIGRRNVYVGNGSAVALVTYGGGTANDAYTGDTELVIESAGAGEAHNNMPPYKNVYIWERTA